MDGITDAALPLGTIHFELFSASEKKQVLYERYPLVYLFAVLVQQDDSKASISFRHGQEPVNYMQDCAYTMILSLIGDALVTDGFKWAPSIFGVIFEPTGNTLMDALESVLKVHALRDCEPMYNRTLLTQCCLEIKHRYLKDFSC